MTGDKIALLTLALAITLVVIAYVASFNQEALQDTPIEGMPISPVAPAVPGAVVPVIPPDMIDSESGDQDEPPKS